MTRVAIDASWFGLTGIGRFADEILKRVPESVEILEVRAGEKNAGILAPCSIRRQLKAVPRCSTFWSPGFFPSARIDRVSQLITIHDLTHLHYYSKAHRVYYDVVMRPLMRNVDTVFTVSEFSRREFIEWSSSDPEKVLAIHHGLSPTFCPGEDRVDLGAPYVLYVGNRREYKNLARLLEAYAKSGLPAKGYLLALSGDADPHMTSLAAGLGLTGHVRFLGVIPESRLAPTYRGAAAVAFISLYEGFGFPIIEGMGCGVPVLTSSVSCMPEIAGGAALLVDPLDVEAIAESLHAICTDAQQRETLRSAGLRRAQDFDWDRAASAYWERIMRTGERLGS